MPKPKLYDEDLRVSILESQKEQLLEIAMKKRKTAADLIRDKLEEFVVREQRAGRIVKRRRIKKVFRDEKTDEIKVFMIIHWNKDMKKLFQSFSSDHEMSMSAMVRKIVDELLKEETTAS